MTTPLEPLGESREPDLKIGEWWVRPQLNEIERGETTVRVEARSMAVLVCLARHAPDVVSKQRIIEEVWGEAFVGDEVISHSIWELRKAFEDDARNPRYIQTIPRKGYRLRSEVVRPSGSPVPIEGEQVDRFEIVEELGRGAMGVVYEAIDRKLRRTVALKFLAPELTRDATARSRFEREAELAASQDHPNLATVFETGETSQGQLYIVTAYYGGGNLQERLASGPLGWPEAVELGRQLASGLERAHRNGIVHRDVKPANILFTDDGTAKLVDFGIAKLLGATSLTRTGASLGTPAYKSPEQSRGAPVDHRTDIWSLGVVLYELITGRQPFRGDYEHAVVHSILEDEPAPLMDPAGQPVPAQLQRVVHKAMAKEPAERYQSAAELVADLERCRDGVSIDGQATRHRRIGWKIGLAAVLALALVSGYLLLRGDGPASAVDTEVAHLLEQGAHYERRGDDVESLDLAERAYRDALAIAPGDPDAQAHLALLLALRAIQIQSPAPETLTEIRELVDAALASDSKSSRPWLAQARLSLLEDDAARVETAARRAIELDPEDDRGYTFLGLALINQGLDEEGLEWIRRGTEVGLGHIRARLVLARRYWLLGKENAAIVEYEEVLEKYAPDHPTARNNLGILYLLSNRDLKALEMFRALHEEKKDQRFANNIGTALFNLERWDEAIDAFREAHELDPSYVNAAVGLGDSYWMKGETAEANRWFEAALALYDRILEEGSVKVGRIGERAVCLAKLGRLDEAEGEIRRALERKPGRASLLFNAAQIRALAGDRKELYQATRRAVETGISRGDFLKDPCFRDFRQDQGFLEVLQGR